MLLWALAGLQLAGWFPCLIGRRVFMRQDKLSENGTGDGLPKGEHRSRLVTWLSPRRWFFWLVVAVLLYTLAGFFLAPRLIENSAVKAVSATGRSLKFGAIRVNPFVLSLELRDTVLRDTDGAVLFSCDDAYVNLQLSSLIHWAWTLREFRLLKPYVNLERFRNGENRIGNLLQAFAGKATAQAAAPAPSAPPRLIVQRLDWSQARLAFTDDSRDPVFKANFGPIEIDVSDLSTLPDRTGRQKVSITTDSGGTIAWSGSLQLSPLLSQGHVTVSGQGLEDLQRYLATLLPFTTRTGGMDVTFDYRVGMGRQDGLELALENLSGLVRDIQLQLPDTPDDLLRLSQLQFAGGAFYWPQRKISLASVSLDAAQLNVVRLPDGSLDLEKLVPAATEQAPAAADATPADAWSIDLKTLALTGGAIGYTDQTMKPAATAGVHDLTLSVSAISNQANARFPTRLELQLGGGGTVSFDGETGMLPAFSAAGALTVKQAVLAMAQPWVAQIAHVGVASGTASLAGRLTHNVEELAGYEGSARIDGFALTDTHRNERLLGVESLASDRIEVSLQHRSVKTSELKLTKPYGRVAIAPDKTTNLTGLMVAAPERAAPERAGQDQAAAPPLAISLGGIDVANASLDFSDRSLPLPFAAAIHALNGKISTLSNASSQAAKVQLEGKVDKYGLARISGSVNPWSFGANSDLKVVFRNLETAHLSPYTIEFAGYEIDDGRLDLDLDYQIRKGKLQGSNKIVSHQLKLGKKVETPGGSSLPLELAVALLTDSKGVIDLDVPISGDINDPQFRIGGVVTKALFGLIGKIVTSPFALLGKLVGAKSEGFGRLDFTPGSAEISPPDQEKLVKLAAAMRQRPELVLEVGGVYAADADRAALQAQRLDAELAARIETEKTGKEELSTAVQRRALEALFTQAFPATALATVQAEYMQAATGNGSPPAQPKLDETAYLEGLRQQLVAHEPVADADLAQLAVQRADAVLGALKTSEGAAELSVHRVEAQAVKATPAGEVPLELNISVADKARKSAAPGP